MNYTIKEYNELLLNGGIESVYTLPETHLNQIEYLNSRRFLTFKEWRTSMQQNKKLKKVDHL